MIFKFFSNEIIIYVSYNTTEAKTFCDKINTPQYNEDKAQAAPFYVTGQEQ